DTFGRVFSLIAAKNFLTCFQGWIKTVFEVTQGQVIAIDGKTLRRSMNKCGNKKALHIVHACVFRLQPNTHSGTSRTLISDPPEHAFRRYPNTEYGSARTPISA